MIVTMTAFEIVLMVFCAFCYENMPIWAKVLCLLAWFIVHLIAYVSEDNLREKVKRLEAQVKKIEKGGE